MGRKSTFATTLQPDAPIAINSKYSFDNADREYIDAQQIASQKALADNVLNGLTATFLSLDGGSVAVDVGDVVTPYAAASMTVTKATGSALAAAVTTYVVVQAAAPGTKVRVVTAGVVPNSVTGLPASAGYVRVSTAGRCERVNAFAPGDVQLGTLSASGDLAILGPKGADGAPGTPGSSAYTANTQTASVAIGDVGVSANVDGTPGVTKITSALALSNGRARVGIVTAPASPGSNATLQTAGLVAASVTSNTLVGSGPSDVIANLSTSKPVRTSAYRPGVDVFLGVANAQGVLNLDALPITTTPRHSFDACSYGAPSDGTGTATAGINAAHAATAGLSGTAVTLLPIVYQVDDSILFTQKHARYSGAHRDTTILRVTGALASGAGGLFAPAAGATNLGHIVIEDMTWDLQGSFGQAPYGMFLQSLAGRCESLTLRNLRIIDPGAGAGGTGKAIWLVGMRNVTIDHVIIEGGASYHGRQQGAGLELDGCSNVVVSHLTVRQLQSGWSGSNANRDVRFIACDGDGCIYTAPACLIGPGAGVTYSSTTLTDASVVNWSTTCASYPDGIVVRVLETRVTGTIATVGSDRRTTVHDATTFPAVAVDAASNGASAPATLHANASIAGFPASGTLLVDTTTGPQIVTYGGKSGNDFTTCAGWRSAKPDDPGTLATGGRILCAYGILEQELVRSPATAPNRTSITSGSNAQTLPQATLNVKDTTAFAASGTVYVQTNLGWQAVAYTGKTGTTFTGCTGGTGKLYTDRFVRDVALFWEMNVTKDGVEAGIVHGDGWRDADTGEFGIGPAAGDTYVVHRVTLAQPFPAGQAGNALSIGYWYGFDGSRRVPANGSRYEFVPQSDYVGHLATTGSGPRAQNWTMIACSGKRTFGDPFSVWDPATLVACYAEFALDTCFTFNADDGVTALGCIAYMAGSEAFYVSSVASRSARHVLDKCKAIKWGWASKYDANGVSAAFRLFGIQALYSGCEAYADNMACAKVAFEFASIDSQMLDCKPFNLPTGCKDLWIYAGAANSLAKSYIRGRHVVDQTIPAASFLGSPVWDLRTPQRVNGVIAGQPTSRVVSEFDGRLYLQQIGNTSKAGWKVAQIADPPDWSPIDAYGSSKVVSWVRVDGNITVASGLAHSVAEQGLMAANVPTAAHGDMPYTTPDNIGGGILSIANNGSGVMRALFAANHGLTTGAKITITGSGGVADGNWVVTEIDATHVDLVGSTYTSTATGTAKDFYFKTQGLGFGPSRMLHASWGGSQITNADATLLFVGRLRNAGGAGGFGYAVEHNDTGVSAFARAGGEANYQAGTAYHHPSAGIVGDLPIISVVVWDVTNGATYYYENDGTTPLDTKGAPGNSTFGTYAMGGDYNGGAGGYYAEGEGHESVLLNKALSAAEVYDAIVGLYLKHARSGGFTIVT